MPTGVDNLGFLQEISFRRGADLDIILELFENQIGGDPYDATGCTINARVKARDGSVTWNFTVVTPPDSTGTTMIRLPAVTTAAIPASPASKIAAPIYDWFVDITLANGSIYPFCYGPAYSV